MKKFASPFFVRGNKFVRNNVSAPQERYSMLAEKESYQGFQATPKPDLRIPLIDMPVTAQEAVKGIDAVILTHTHLDHWDEAAQRLIPKDIPFLSRMQEMPARFVNRDLRMLWLSARIPPLRM